MKELEIMSSIEGTTSTEKNDNLLSGDTATVDDLRDDIVIEASDDEKQSIIDSFPNEKNNYLVVPRVIEE